MMNDVSVNFFFDLRDVDLFVLYDFDFEGDLDRDLELDDLLQNLDLLFALCDLDLEGDLDRELELDDA